MLKKTTKKVIRRALATVIAAALVCCGVPYSMEVHAASGSWVLTSESVGICVGFKDSNYVSHDLIYGDGSSEVTSGKTISTDKTHSYTYSYLGKFDGSVRFMESGGYIWDTEKAQTSDNYSDCSIPESSYAPGATVTLKIHTWTENVVGDGLASRRVASIGASGAGYTGSHGDDMKNADGKTSFDQNSTNPNTQYSWVPIKGEATITVMGTMPKDPKEGQTCTIYYTTDAGQYEWNYTYSESAIGQQSKKDHNKDKTEKSSEKTDNKTDDKTDNGQVKNNPKSSVVEESGLTLSFDDTHGSKVVVTEAKDYTPEDAVTGCYKIDLSDFAWTNPSTYEYETVEDLKKLEWDDSGMAHVRLKVTSKIPDDMDAFITIGLPFEDEEGDEYVDWHTVSADCKDGYLEAYIDLGWYAYFDDCSHHRNATGRTASSEPAKKQKTNSSGTSETSEMLIEQSIIKLDPKKDLFISSNYGKTYYYEHDGKTYFKINVLKHHFDTDLCDNPFSAEDIKRILNDVYDFYNEYIGMGYKVERDLSEYPLEISFVDGPWKVYGYKVNYFASETDGAYYSSPVSINRGTMELTFNNELKVGGYRRPKKSKINDNVSEELYRTIAHEMFHFFQNQYYADSLVNLYVFWTPGDQDWFHEGTAIYYEDLLAKKNGIGAAGSALYSNNAIDIFSGLKPIDDHQTHGYACRPFFEYLDKNCGKNIILKFYQDKENHEYRGVYSDLYQEKPEILTKSLRGGLVTDFYRVLITKNELNASSITDPWIIYNKGEDFKNHKDYHPERVYQKTVNLDCKNINGSGTASTNVDSMIYLYGYGYGAFFIKVIPENLPKTDAMLTVTAQKNTDALTVMTYDKELYSDLKVYMDDKTNKVSVPLDGRKILVMVINNGFSDAISKVSFSIGADVPQGNYPSGKEKVMPSDFSGTLKRYTYTKNNDGNTEKKVTNTDANAALTMGGGKGSVKIQAEDGSYSFTVSGSYSPANGTITGDNSSACIFSGAPFSESSTPSPYSAQGTDISIHAYQYDGSGNLIAEYTGDDVMGDIPSVEDP
jgi:hypothetical protein